MIYHGFNSKFFKPPKQAMLYKAQADCERSDLLLNIEEKAEVRELYMSILLSIRKYFFSELMPRMKKQT